MSKTTNKVIQKSLFYLVLSIVIIYLVFPFYWAVNTSLKSEAQLQMTPATWLPRNPSTGKIKFYLENYVDIFKAGQFTRGLKNSAIVATSTTLLALLVGSFAAFALGKLRFKGKTVSLYLILSMTMFPSITVLTGLFAIIRFLNMDAIFSMILTYMIFTLPFTTWVMTAFFKDLPIELMQSAQVDGATPFQTFYMILLPLTAPALVTTGLLSFIAAWNEYLFALTFTSIESSDRTVPVAISMFQGTVERQEPVGERMAAAVLVTIPIVILVLIFQKKIVQGLTAGAVKG